MNSGLNERDVRTLYGIFKKYDSVTSVFLFGSRAKGNYKPGSDIDLAVMNEGISDDVISAMKADFEDSSLPYFVDLVSYGSLQSEDLKQHIHRAGIAFYSSQG